MKKTILIALGVILAILAVMAYFGEQDQNYDAERLVIQACKEKFVRTGVPCEGRANDGQKN